MAATLQFVPHLTLQAPPATGTENFMELRLKAAAAFSAVSDTLAQIRITPDNNVSGDDQAEELRLMATLVSCTLTHGTNKVNSTAHGLSNGQPVNFSGTLPAEIVAGTTYYVISAATNDFEISATVGGSAVDFTSNGSGVQYRALGLITPAYSYPASGPAVPPVIEYPSTAPLDFTRVKAIHALLRARDTASNASGQMQVTLGDPTDRYGHANLPLKLSFTAAGEENWPSGLLILPAGLDYNTSYHLTVRTKAGTSNTNLLLLLNLLGN